ncbi:MAG: Crp/Fnr family transcriptional regulator [Thermodesulfovibrionales bacterium]|nr:Crp/Fnr family transcriptional regulator [Thermodesulfovibrionales bacterium]
MLHVPQIKPIPEKESLSSFLKSITIFSNLDDCYIKELKSHIYKKKFRKGQSIFLEHETDIPLYIIWSGRLKAYKCTSCGKEQIVRLVKPGDVLCLTSIFCGSTCACTEALEDSLVYVIDKADLLKLIQRHPTIAINFLSYFAEHLRKFSHLIENLSLKDVTYRLRELLLEHSVINKDGRRICTLTKKEMASLVGTVREVVGRSLKKLEDNGLIEVRHREVVLLKLEKL